MRHGGQIEFFGRTILQVTVRFGSGRFGAVPNDQPKRIGRLTVSNQDDLWLPLSKTCWRNEKAHHESKQRQEFPAGHVLMSYPRYDTYFIVINRLRIETRAKRQAPGSERESARYLMISPFPSVITIFPECADWLVERCHGEPR